MRSTGHISGQAMKMCISIGLDKHTDGTVLTTDINDSPGVVIVRDSARSGLLGGVVMNCSLRVYDMMATSSATCS